ncbi:hypothetical protein LZC95_50065 [Pendulispora brunnea]|uniref:Antitoxin n=1 Tax=Pendulispora brunnea TaxID=2905690 RepID=A0ABZ2KAZ7_9BACT
MPDAEIRRGLQARSGAEVADVEMPVFWVECKHHRQVNIRAALRQAVEAAPQGRIPIAVTKDDGAAPIVTLGLDDFLEFVGEWWTRRER